MNGPFKGKYTGRHEFTIEGNGDQSTTFNHPGGDLKVSRIDDANITAGTTKLQTRHTDSGTFADFVSGSLNTEMTDTDALVLELPECQIQVNTALFNRSDSEAAIRLVLESVK